MSRARAPRWVLLSVGLAVAALASATAAQETVNRLEPPNIRPVPVLSLLDIDNDDLPDGAGDADGDGLPDNWEVGAGPGGEPPARNGVRPDRFLQFSAPTAIGPGTPPTFIFARLIITTSATTPDTDQDGLTDFVEVFGLKYIDENNNGILDFEWTDADGNGQFDLGEQGAGSEWADLNGDGLPSVGEFPLPNIDPVLNRDHDFDGFMFTDPTVADTDGDGINDRDDADPLINPSTFGVEPGLDNVASFTRPGINERDQDLDNDGLGNGSDFGNDRDEIVNYPSGIRELIKLFRPDRLADNTIPEGLIEDLIGADWDGNGLFRITDQRSFHQRTTREELQRLLPARFEQLFIVEARELFAEYEGPTTPARDVPYGQRDGRLGFQELLLPAGDGVSQFLPDIRVWTVLYAWRMPGFDIDGDGYVGSAANDFANDDVHPFEGTGIPGLDGRIDVDLSGPLADLCGSLGGLLGFTLIVGVYLAIAPRMARRTKRRR